jgi:hypothetical protein
MAITKQALVQLKSLGTTGGALKVPTLALIRLGN